MILVINILNTFKYLKFTDSAKIFQLSPFFGESSGFERNQFFFILIVYDTEMQRSGFKFSLFLCLALMAIRENYTSYKNRQILEVYLHPWLYFLSHL